MASTDFWSERERMGRVRFPPPFPHRMESLQGPGSSNVVIRDFLLQGPHPGSSTGEIIASLKPLLAAGVTTFVCLQQELPSSATASHLSSRSSSFGSGGVVSAKPYFEGAQAMVKAGGYPMSSNPDRLSFVHYPMPPTSGFVPDDKTFKAVVQDLLAYMMAGEYIYLHCSDGNGRSGCIAAALLALVYSMGPTEALEHLQVSRRQRPGAVGASPDTHEQRMAVHRILTPPTPLAPVGPGSVSAIASFRPSTASGGSRFQHQHQQQQQQQQYQSSAAPSAAAAAASAAATAAGAGPFDAATRATIAAALAPPPNSAREAFVRHSDGVGSLTAAALGALQGKLVGLNAHSGGSCALLKLRKLVANSPHALPEEQGSSTSSISSRPRALGGRIRGRVSRGGLKAVGEACGWFLTGGEEETLWEGAVGVENTLGVSGGDWEGGGGDGGDWGPEVGGEGGAGGGAGGDSSMTPAAAAAAHAKRHQASFHRHQFNYNGNGGNNNNPPPPPSSSTGAAASGSGSGSAATTVSLAALFACVRGASVGGGVASLRCTPPREAAIEGAWRRLGEIYNSSASASGSNGSGGGVGGGRAPGAVVSATSFPNTSHGIGVTQQHSSSSSTTTTATSSSLPRGLPLSLLASQFKAAGHPEVKAGKKSEEGVLGEFLETFGVRSRYPGSTITWGEFAGYYRDVSHGVPQEGAFVAVLEGCWPPRSPPLTMGGGGGTGGGGGAGNAGTASSAIGGAPPPTPSIFPPTVPITPRNIPTVMARLAAYLTSRVSDFTVAHLGYTLRKYDDDGDGLIGLDGFRGALKESITACFHAESGGGAAAAAQHAPLINDQDVGGIFTALHTFLAEGGDRSGGGSGSRGGSGGGGGGGTSHTAPLPLASILSLLHNPAGSGQNTTTTTTSSPLSPPRARLVTSLWASLDPRGEGAIPLPSMSGHFKAEAHPVCAAGRRPPVHLYRLFRDSFSGAGRMVDERGPQWRHRPGPGAEAYYGSGDGLCRFQFFAEWCAGIGAAYPANGGGVGGGGVAGGRPGTAAALAAGVAGGDSEFSLIISSLWSGGGLVGEDTRCKEGESDLASILVEGGKRGGPGARWAPNSYGGSGSGNGSGGAGGASLYQQQQHSGVGVGSPSRAPIPNHLAYEGQSASMRGLLPGPPSNNRGAAATHSPGGFNAHLVRGGGLGTLRSSNGGGGGGGGAAAAAPASGFAGPSGTWVERGNEGYTAAIAKTAQLGGGGGGGGGSSPALSALMSDLRSSLTTRGIKVSFRLVTALERAAQACGSFSTNGSHTHGSSGRDSGLYQPLPMHALLTCLRDCGFMLDSRGVGVIREAFDINGPANNSSSSSSEVIPWEVLATLHGSPLPRGRSDLVGQAWDQLCRLTSDGRAYSPPGTPTPSLEDVYKLRESAGYGSHPEVKAGKRGEEEVEKEFLSTFTPGLVGVGGGGGSGSGEDSSPPVTEQGFFNYYTLLSPHYPLDAHFTALLFDSWKLQNASDPACGGGAMPAGASTGSGMGGGGGGGGGGGYFPPKRDASVATLLGAPAPSYSYGARGPGTEGLPPSAYGGREPAPKGWGIETFGVSSNPGRGGGGGGGGGEYQHQQYPPQQQQYQQQQQGRDYEGGGGGGGGGMPRRPQHSVAGLLGGTPAEYRVGPRGPGTEGLPREAYGGPRADPPPGWGVERFHR